MHDTTPSYTMQFSSNHLYHIYNQGNNRQQIFFNSENYLYFLRKVNTLVAPVCNILAWCLMPNHFHFLVGTSPYSVEKIKVGNLYLSRLSNGFRILESSYAKGINAQYNWSGSIFRQRTKAKCLTEEAFDYEEDSLLFAPDFFNPYPLTCFHYIHQNAWEAGLVKNPQDWVFSSLRDYLGIRTGNLCHYDLCKRWVGVDRQALISAPQLVLKPEFVRGIFAT